MAQCIARMLPRLAAADSAIMELDEIRKDKYGFRSAVRLL